MRPRRQFVLRRSLSMVAIRMSTWAMLATPGFRALPPQLVHTSMTVLTRRPRTRHPLPTVGLRCEAVALVGR